MNPRRFFLGLFCFLLLAALPCSVFAQNTLRWVVADKIQTLDPHAFANESERAVLSQLYETLFTLDAEHQPQPELVAAWEQLSPNHWEFVLHPTVRFHNDQKLQASDVVFSLKRAMQEGSTQQAHTYSLRGIEAIDELRIRVTTSRPNPLLLRQLTHIFMVSEPWMRSQRRADLSAGASGSEASALLQTNGTGPFRLLSLERDTLELGPSANWWQPVEHQVGSVQIRVEPDALQQVELLEDDVVDLLTNAAPEHVPRLQADPSLRLAQQPQARTLFLGFNVLKRRSPDETAANPLSSAQVRRALAHAIDRAQLQREHWPAQGNLAQSFLPDVVQNAPPPTIELPAFDPDLARKLLREIGYEEGFPLNLDCPNDRYFKTEEICRSIMEMLIRVGIDVSLNLRPSARHFDYLQQGQSDFFLLGWGVPTGDAHHPLFYLFRSGGTWNFTGYARGLVDSLLEAANTETRLPLRHEMIALAWKVTASDLLYLPLLHPLHTWVTRNNWEIPVGNDGVPHLRQARILPEDS
jgi:peptide/nickel transport system substrate-binding protein